MHSDVFYPGKNTTFRWTLLRTIFSQIFQICQYLEFDPVGSFKFGCFEGVFPLPCGTYQYNLSFKAQDTLASQDKMSNIPGMMLCMRA